MKKPNLYYVKAAKAETEMETERLAAGIPLNAMVEKDLISLGDKFGIGW